VNLLAHEPNLILSKIERSQTVDVMRLYGYVGCISSRFWTLHTKLYKNHEKTLSGLNKWTEILFGNTGNLEGTNSTRTFNIFMQTHFLEFFIKSHNSKGWSSKLWDRQIGQSNAMISLAKVSKIRPFICLFLLLCIASFLPLWLWEWCLVFVRTGMCMP